ncbi:hypothetical protein ACFFK8_13055 [Hallella seregens ATCC 51272]|uniref:Uncharacterized protein n=1 Tax=Hallella seregens ATCC 51272 TaxID=1336250 RepID=A0ABV5ZQ56_9BACT
MALPWATTISTSPNTLPGCWNWRRHGRTACGLPPLRDVGAYVQERDHARLRVRQRRGRLVIRVRTGLDPAVFHHPLTLLVDGRPYRVEMGKRGGRLEIELGK